MPSDLIYATPNFWMFLQDALGCELDVLSTSPSEGGDILMPLLITDGAYGSVANSLPFYGGHGIPLTNESKGSSRIKLLLAIEKKIEDGDFQAVTLIENPLGPLSDNELSQLRYLNVIDTRTSQMTVWDPSLAVTEDALFERLHTKARNAVRKGFSYVKSIDESKNPPIVDFVVKNHHKSITELGGLPKTARQLELLNKYLGDAVKIHSATTRDGELGAALMTLETAVSTEYFVPVVRQDLRSTQILSALIFEVMLKSFSEGRDLWNWGGTWKSQSGVHRFKSRFGARDSEYRYLHWSSDEIQARPKTELLREHPYWYVRKYSE